MNQLQYEQYRKVNQSEYPCSDHPKISLMRTESRAAGAVEKPATERAVSVVYLRESIDISKINAAFLTGQQINRIHVQ